MCTKGKKVEKKDEGRKTNKKNTVVSTTAAAGVAAVAHIFSSYFVVAVAVKMYSNKTSRVLREHYE